MTDSPYTVAGLMLVTTNQTGTATTSVDIDDFTQTDRSASLPAVASYGYDPAGQATKATLTGGVTRTWAHTNGQIGTYTQTGANPVTDTLAYDPVGRLASINATQDTFSYDLMDQLMSETHGSTTISYTYDGDGRRRTRTEGASTLPHTYDDAFQLTSIDDGTSFTYDDAGQRLTGSGPGFADTFGYDTGGRVESLTRVEGTATTSETRSYGTPLTAGATALPKCPSDFGQLDDFAGPCAIGPSYGESSAYFPYLGQQPLALACSHSQVPTNTRWYATPANIQDGDVNVDCTVLFSRATSGSVNLLMGIEHSRTHVIENDCGVRPIRIGTVEIQIPRDLIQDRLNDRLRALRNVGINVDCVPFLNKANGWLSGNLRTASKHNSCLGFRVRAEGVDFDGASLGAPSGWEPVVVTDVELGGYIVRFRRDLTTVCPGCYG